MERGWGIELSNSRKRNGGIGKRNVINLVDACSISILTIASSYIHQFFLRSWPKMRGTGSSIRIHPSNLVWWLNGTSEYHAF